MSERGVSGAKHQTPRCAFVLGVVLGLGLAGAPHLDAQTIQPSRGVDPRVDYPALTHVGPWDDRNYQLTAEDLALLAPNEEEQRDPIPAFFRVQMRRAQPEMRRRGPAQYPRSALQIFLQLYGGFQVDGRLYSGVRRVGDRWEVLLTEEDNPREHPPPRFLSGESRVTSPQGAAESAVKISPVDADWVIAGSNGPGSGQKMHFSTDGGVTWTESTALPGGGTCCDPTVDWSSDGSLAYAATLGSCGASGCQVWIYRSDDGGQTWGDLSGTPARRTVSTGSGNDKEFLHVDKHPTSPHVDNVYVTWHSSNVMQFARSTDGGDTWSTLSFSSSANERGIGSDITTDKSGNVYYLWPAFNAEEILLRKSTDGGASFGSTSTVDSTEGSFTFPLPSMETREAFIYVSADADLTSGPYANSIYAAWTDATAATTSTPENNHAVIRVAYSRDGGASWTTVSPHETDDLTTVDRYHPWLAVGSDGTVHVVFYDTRNSPGRTSVDLYYSYSIDGAQSFSPPIRVTSVSSPNISDSFEFGDYNGLDVLLSEVIAIFTDNRLEAAGSGDSVDVYAAGFDSARPVVTITSPASGSSFVEGSSISFTGTASDAEDGDLTASLAWESSLQGTIGNGGSFSRSDLLLGVHDVAAQVVDSDGGGGMDSTQVLVTDEFGNLPPVVSISAPAMGSLYFEGTTVDLVGTASDSDDGDLTAGLSWSSSLDGPLGTGGSVSASALSAGLHTLQAVAVDSGGLAGVAQRELTIADSSCSTTFNEDFEGGAAGWTADGLWTLVDDTSCTSPGYSSATRAMYYGQESECDYDTGAATAGDLVSSPITGITGTSELSFQYLRQVEGPTMGSYDLTRVAVAEAGSSAWTTLWSLSSMNASGGGWTSSGGLSLAPWSTQEIQVRFRFDSVDQVSNGFLGWLIDDVEVVDLTDGTAGLELPAQIVTTEEVFEACTWIRAGEGFVIGASGDVTLDAPRSILTNGFEVQDSGVLTVGPQ